MRIKINLTAEIINHCLDLHFSHHPSGRKHKRNLFWIPLILLVIAAYLIYTEFQKNEIGNNFYLALLYSAFAAAYYFYMRRRLLTSGKVMLKSLGNDANFEMEVEENQLKTITSSATISTNWSVFTSALIKNEIVLLYQTNDTFSMFHYSFFKENDFEKFKSLVKNNVRPLIEV